MIRTFKHKGLARFFVKLRMQEAVDLWEARQQPERFAAIKRLPASAAA